MSVLSGVKEPRSRGVPELSGFLVRTSSPPHLSRTGASPCLLTIAGTRTMRIAGTRFGAYQRKRAKTLRSDYDLCDQYMELAANAWPPATSR